MDNLYFPIYKSLEKEVLDLALNIYVDDNQLSVYSLKIAELLVRCGIEIESISKDLYFENGGEYKKKLYFDKHCISFLDKKWNLTRKHVIVCSPYFHFDKEENMKFDPLKNANKMSNDGSPWKIGYNAIKHDRANSLKEHGTLKNLMHALASLYILNIYAQNIDFNLNNDYDHGFIKTFSEIFSFSVCTINGFHYEHKIENYGKICNGDECVYIVTASDKYVQKVIDFEEDIKLKFSEYLLNDSNFIEKFCVAKESKKENNSIIDIIGSDMYIELLKKFLSISKKRINIADIQYVAMLNKNQFLKKNELEQENEIQNCYSRSVRRVKVTKCRKSFMTLPRHRKRKLHS